jgi:thermostable 8-oxoguanine DNA glycosylase
MMSDKYTVETVGKAEQEFIGASLIDPLISSVVVCMSRENSLYHQTLKGIAKNIHDEAFYVKADAWYEEYIQLGERYKNVKVRALRRLAGWFNLLADAFEYVEERKEPPLLSEKENA